MRGGGRLMAVVNFIIYASSLHLIHGHTRDMPAPHTHTHTSIKCAGCDQGVNLFYYYATSGQSSY